MSLVPYDIQDFKIGEGPDSSGYIPFTGRVKKHAATANAAQDAEDYNSVATAYGMTFKQANANVEAANAKRAANANKLKEMIAAETAAAATEAAAAKKKADDDAASSFNDQITSKENAIAKANNNMTLTDIIQNLGKIQKHIVERFPDESETRTVLINRIYNLRELAKAKKRQHGGGTRKYRKNLRKTRKNRK